MGHLKNSNDPSVDKNGLVRETSIRKQLKIIRTIKIRRSMVIEMYIYDSRVATRENQRLRLYFRDALVFLVIDESIT